MLFSAEALKIEHLSVEKGYAKWSWFFLWEWDFGGWAASLPKEKKAIKNALKDYQEGICPSALAAKFNLKIHQMDAVTVFLQADLVEEIYIEKSEGFENLEGNVFLLKKVVWDIWGWRSQKLIHVYISILLTEVLSFWLVMLIKKFKMKYLEDIGGHYFHYIPYIT